MNLQAFSDRVRETLASGLRLGAQTLLVGALLTVGALAQRCELLIEVECSVLNPGQRGQAVTDQPRRVEVKVEVTDPQGGVTEKTLSASLLRGATARLAATLLATQVNGQGSTPGQNCEIESTDPSNPDWVEREDEISLELPDGVKVKSIRVLKRSGGKWVSSCAGHLKVSERAKTSTGGLGRIGMLQDLGEPLGLRLELTGSDGAGDEWTVAFGQAYPAGTSAEVALDDLADFLTESGAEVALDGLNLWILSSPFSGPVHVTYGVWHDDLPFECDDPDAPANLGLEGDWSGVGIEFEAL